jgi:dienelactone hydrolase
VSVGGRDGACWNIGTDTTLVLAALDDVKTRLNVDPRRVTIGGYSSGGNLAYRTAFYNAGTFAGILAENTGPFYGTGSSQADSIAAAAWKLNVVHLAHTGDTTYPIATIRNEMAALKAAGFPATLLEQAGTHWDSDTTSSGTNHDLRTYLLPFLDAGWRSPG